jgi:CheY-like chemotaxis protein
MLPFCHAQLRLPGSLTRASSSDGSVMNRESPKILVVEEDELLAEITAFRLELLGYGVDRAQTGEAALERITDAAPDLIILDLYLPGMDGLELMNRLKSDPKTAEIPVLVFSTAGDLDVVGNAHAAGADDYLVTPYDPAVLQDKIARLLETAVGLKA